MAIHPLQQYLDAAAREHATTLKLLRAYPAGKDDLRPAPVSKTARELAWIFVMEQGLLEVALTKGFDWSAPPPESPEAPATVAEIAGILEATSWPKP
jgi:hypothetical protein